MKKYDYIILDTPPVGLVSDALELAEFCDVTLYIVSKISLKGYMITLLNNRVKRRIRSYKHYFEMGLQIKPKYGTGYGYGYGYGMRPFLMDIMRRKEPKSIYERVAHKLLRKKTDYNLLISDKNEGKNDFDYRRCRFHRV
jgi:hypothetical protein